MSSEPPINPYQAPEQAAPSPEGSDELSPLADPRPFAYIAIVSILLTTLAGIGDWFHFPDFSWLKQYLGALLLFSGFAYLVWIYRCASNARVMDPHHAASPAWTIGSHLIPMVNWIAPCLVLRSLSKTTFKHTSQRGMGTVIFAWWLALFVIPILSTLMGDPFVQWGERIGISLSSVLITYIILRISQTQANFRWSDLPESERPYQMRRGGTPQPIQYPRPSRPTAGTSSRPNFLPPRPRRPTREAETSTASPDAENS